MGRWGGPSFHPYLHLISIAIFTHSVFECPPRCTGLVQLCTVLAKADRARPVAQVYRARPVSPKCTGFTHDNGERKSNDGCHTEAS